MCTWPGNDKLMQQYHDEEWGVPVLNDRKHFEFLILESFQAGLSWKTILHRRKGFKKAFVNFDYKKVAKNLKKDTSQIWKRKKSLKIHSFLSLKSAILLVLGS